MSLDGSPGTFICTSGTRPTWGAGQAGMAIYETDTKLVWHWSGAAWERVIPKGLVSRSESLADFATSSTVYVIAISTTATVAAGGRRHLVIVEAPGVFNTNALSDLAVFRGATMLQEWKHQGATGAPATSAPRGLSFITTDLPTAISTTWSLQVKATAAHLGTSTIQGATNKPLSITVVEI